MSCPASVLRDGGPRVLSFEAQPWTVVVLTLYYLSFFLRERQRTHGAVNTWLNIYRERTTNKAQPWIVGSASSTVFKKAAATYVICNRPLVAERCSWWRSEALSIHEHKWAPKLITRRKIVLDGDFSSADVLLAVSLWLPDLGPLRHTPWTMPQYLLFGCYYPYCCLFHVWTVPQDLSQQPNGQDHADPSQSLAKSSSCATPSQTPPFSSWAPLWQYLCWTIMFSLKLWLMKLESNPPTNNESVAVWVTTPAFEFMFRTTGQSKPTTTYQSWAHTPVSQASI